MANLTLDIEKFTGKNDFGLWKVKMQALLVHNGLANALLPESEWDSSSTRDKKAEILMKAHNTIILCLGDKPLREVAKEKRALDVWKKLEKIFLTKFVTNKLFMKQKLIAFKITDGKDLSDQLDEFNRLFDDLENLEVKLGDDDKSLMLLNALPKSFEHFKDALLFGRLDEVSFDDVQNALKTKFLQMQGDKKSSNNGEELMLNIQYKKGKKPSHKKKGGDETTQSDKKPTADGFVERRKCFACHKQGHLKKDCPGKEEEQEPHEADFTMANEGYESAEVLVLTESKMDEWVLDSGCPFHMCPNRSWFKEFEEIDGGSMYLGNDQTCRIEGIGSVSMRMFDGKERLLTRVRYVPNLRRNLISLGALTRLGCEFKTDKGQFFVTKSYKVVIKGKKANGLYILIGKAVLSEQETKEEKSDELAADAKLPKVFCGVAVGTVSSLINEKPSSVKVECSSSEFDQNSQSDKEGEAKEAGRSYSLAWERQRIITAMCEEVKSDERSQSGLLGEKSQDKRLVSRFMVDPGKLHWKGMKWIMKYCNGPLNLGLWFQNSDARRDSSHGYVNSKLVNRKFRCGASLIKLGPWTGN